jgi:hypothetical protein
VDIRQLSASLPFDRDEGIIRTARLGASLTFSLNLTFSPGRRNKSHIPTIFLTEAEIR